MPLAHAGSQTVSKEESQDKRARLKLVGAVVILVIAGTLMARYMTRTDSAGQFASDRIFKCAECGHDFEHTSQMGEIEPIPCPKCGKQAGYQAEKCYWTRDASGGWKAKVNPTYVLMKTRVDPSSTEKTLCPDCNHVVVTHNPRPSKELMDAAEKEAHK
jgi:DNA-directed RNA polymerase subunit RPC12/RpoP